jgi:hypothetical protein
LLRHQGQSDAGVPGGGLDDGAAGLELPVALGFLDHLRRDAVLDGAAGVHVFQLHEDSGLDALGDVVELDERGVADEIQDRLGVLHGYQLTVLGCRTGAGPRHA